MEVKIVVSTFIHSFIQIDKLSSAEMWVIFLTYLTIIKHYRTKILTLFFYQKLIAKPFVNES